MEKIRSFVRERLGYRSSLYIVASKLTNYSFAFLRGGRAGIRVVSASAIPITGEWIKLRTLTHPIFIRSVEEDIGSIINNIFREEYGQIPKHFEPQLIVDAGAYIGDTSAYFLSRYPDASLLSLEPNPESYEIAGRNLSGYGKRVNLLNAALAPEDGSVRISGLATGARVSTEGQEVAAISITTLLSKSDFHSIDILKMDIEGHEVPVLTENSEGWLPKVKWLLLETHGEHIEDELLPFLKAKGFSIGRHRNVWYCEKKMSLE